MSTNDKSPVGNHKSVFVELLTPVNGAQTRMSGGATELQIAQPAPAAPATPAEAAAPPPPAPPAAKPLTRLEKLRQQAGGTK